MFFTSSYEFEARGCTIIPIQSSQEEILDFTSNLQNSPLATLDYNNKIIVPSVAVILVKEIRET